MGVGRVVLRSVNTGGNRGRGAVKAIIHDGANIGASTYRDGGGEFHMTLPSNHPQAGSCEPWLTHYAVEENVNGTWIERFAGLLSDFDATDNDIVVYGIDYLALLDMVVDSRYDKDAAKKAPPEGSYWSSKAIGYIVGELIDYARTKANSPVAFIDKGRIQSMPEQITIFSTFVSIGRFVQGLLDSHRQGSGARTRLWVARKSGGGYEFRVENNPGRDRPELKMEYGGAVQGFNLIGFGQFTTVAHGIGRTQTGGTLFYSKQSAPSTPPSTWGAIETVAFYDNVSDMNDLSRRVKQAASTAARVGKRVAMGIKVDGLSPFGGYNICDNIPVQIVRGVVDTRRYGSGWWTIHGVEWRIFPDGHTELTLAILPREDGRKPSTDLLVDQEVLPDPLPAVIEQGSITSYHLSTEPPAVTSAAIESLSADKLTGDIVVGNQADGLRVLAFDIDGNPIGEWTDQGILLSDPTNSQYMVRLYQGKVQYTVEWDEITGTAPDASWVDAIIGTGVVGDAITSGVLPGGHNVIPNAGFELAAFIAASQLSTIGWPSGGGTNLPFGTTIGTDVNLNKGATLTMQVATY